MAHKTFISYKYSEARGLRDKIINALPKDYAQYYMGETSDSPDMGDEKTERIKMLAGRFVLDCLSSYINRQRYK